MAFCSPCVPVASALSSCRLLVVSVSHACGKLACRMRAVGRFACSLCRHVVCRLVALPSCDAWCGVPVGACCLWRAWRNAWRVPCSPSCVLSAACVPLRVLVALLVVCPACMRVVYRQAWRMASCVLCWLLATRLACCERSADGKAHAACSLRDVMRHDRMWVA